MNNFSRATSAFVLTASLLASSVAAVAQTPTTKPADRLKKPTKLNRTEHFGGAKADQKKAQPAARRCKDQQAALDQRRSKHDRQAEYQYRHHRQDERLDGKGSPQGREAAAEVDRQAKFVDDPLITEYVNRVGQNIVLHSDAKVPFTIKVIDSDEVNAFALPGGFFYVNKGLLLAADNEAELAGVMAHEIAHVAARHAVENQTKASLLEYAASAARYSWAAFRE
jgi:hypothetical protein